MTDTSHIEVLREMLNTGDVSDWRAFDAALEAAIRALSPAGGDWVYCRDQLAELLLTDPESGERCFIVSTLRSGPGGFQSFDIQSGPCAQKWRIEARITESGVTVPPASGCDGGEQHVGACPAVSVALPRQDNPADTASVACQLCWGDRWMKNGTPCPSCNRNGHRLAASPQQEPGAVCDRLRPGAPCPAPESCRENGCSAVERELFAISPTPADESGAEGFARGLAEHDAKVYGTGFLVDGGYVAPTRVQMITQPSPSGQTLAGAGGEVAAFERWARGRFSGAEVFDRIESRPANEIGLTWEYNGYAVQSAWAAWIGRATLTATSAGTTGDDSEDAERWRALIGSARVRVLGSAGLHRDANIYGEPFNGYAHIGVELWTKHDGPHSPPDAIEWLTKYADAARRARGDSHD